MSEPLVAYFRVSAREQGRSGLGIDAQRGLSSASPMPRVTRSSASSPRLRPARRGCDRAPPATCRGARRGAQSWEMRGRGVQARQIEPRRPFHFRSHGASGPVRRRRARRGRRAVRRASLCRARRERARSDFPAHQGRSEGRQSPRTGPRNPRLAKPARSPTPASGPTRARSPRPPPLPSEGRTPGRRRFDRSPRR